MSKNKKYSTYIITETIVIEQEVCARDYDHALEQYQKMMSEPKNRVALTTEGSTSSSNTTSEIDVETVEDHDERVYE